MLFLLFVNLQHNCFSCDILMFYQNVLNEATNELKNLLEFKGRSFNVPRQKLSLTELKRALCVGGVHAGADPVATSAF